ncbi:MAG: GAF domain-containing protein [Anaerolineae bacterium]|nr:GAF domain-containing protein [Anaerolineae bacterium]
MSRVAQLAQIGKQLAAKSSSDEIWPAALEAILSGLDVDAGAWVWSEPTGGVIANGAAIDPAVWRQLAGYARTDSEPHSVRLPEDVAPLKGVAFAPLRSVAFIPLQAASRHGWLMLGTGREELAPADLEIAAAAVEMARLAVLTIDGERRDGDPARHGGALAAVQRVTDEMGATLELDHILRVVLAEALRTTGGDAGLIVVVSDSGVDLRAWQGYADDTLVAVSQALPLRSGPVLTSSEGALQAWLTGGELLNLPDLADDQAPLPDMRSAVVAPVFYEQRLAAAILLQSATPAFFNDDALAVCRALAGQTALAVGNARRYQEQVRRGEQMRQRAEQMSLLLEISRTMRSDRPLDETLADVAYAVQEGTGFELVLISVLEGNLLRRVAGAGIPLVELEERKRVRLRWDRVRRLCQEQFRVGQCYYIPERFRHLTQDLDVFVPQGVPVGPDAEAWHQEDIYFVPLRNSAGDIIGILSVDRPRNGKAPTAITSEVVELFAAQVAQTIETHRLVGDLRRQVTTLQLFNELNRSITTKLDLPMVLNTVVQSVTNVLGYDFSTIFLRDTEEQTFVPLASSGYALELLTETPLDGSGGAIGEVVRTGMPLLIEDAPHDSRFQEGRVPIGSSIMVPMMVDGHSVGILTADRKRKGEFSPADVATMLALADQVTVAVENARLFEEVKRFNEELESRVAERTQELADALERLRFQRDRSEVLYHIASELVASLDMDRVLSQALLLLQRAVKATRSSVILLDRSTGRLVYRAAIGHSKPIPPGGMPAPFSRDEGIVGWTLEKRQPLVIPDVTAQTDFAATPLEGVRSVMAVPVTGGSGEALGVLLLESAAVDVFDEPQLRLVEAAAVQLGNALNNAELYGMIREQAERMGAMLRTQQIDVTKNQAILEGIADGVMFTDAGGQVILFNAAAERILSITRDQALGRPQEEILGLYGSEVHVWLSQIDQWREDREAYEREGYLSHRLEVGRRYVSVHLSPVVTETGEFLGVASVFRDITAEIEADRAKSDFVSTVSHELRTPMTSIVGYVDLMLAGAAGEIPEMQLAFLEKVKTNADRLTNLVNDLLDISRLEQGRVELLRRPVDMGTLVTQVADLVRPRIEERQQTIATIVPDALPRVYGDPDRLTQILTNLVSNAYKYTPVGGEIAIHTYVRQGMVYVAVVDSGIGIAPENQNKIFERFYRVEDDPAVYEVSGTGLGLAITLSLIQMHGGDIWLESELGLGSIFTFSVPLAHGEPAIDVGEAPQSFVKPAAPQILVVEDDAEIAELLRVTFESEGFRVLVASSGEDALHLSRQEAPDFVSLDVRLPDLDGLEVLQLLKRDPATADIPVAIVSVAPERDRGMALGALAYLTKPLDAQKLLEIVKRALSQRETVIVAHSDREFLNRLRSVLQLRGLNVRTTMRGDRALQLAGDLQPRLVVMAYELPDMACRQLVDLMRRDRRTAEIPLVITSAPEYLGRPGDADAPAWEAVHFMTASLSIEGLGDALVNIIDADGQTRP